MKASRNFHHALTISSLQGLDNKISSLLKRLQAIRGFAHLSHALVRDLRLLLMEGVTNAVKHGQGHRQKSVRVIFEASPQKIKIQIEDPGAGLNLARALRRQATDVEEHGRGLWILKNLSDSVVYRHGKPNRLILVRQLIRPKKIDAAIELFDRLQEGIQQLKPKEVLYNTFIDFIVDLFNVERASFLIYNRDSQMLKVATSRGIPAKLVSKISIAPGEGIAGYVFQTSRPLLVNHLAKMKKGTPSPRKKGYHTSSFVSVPVIASPLHIGEETLGVLNLTDKRDGSRFQQNELKLLNLMAGQAASVFRIYDLIETVKIQEGWKRELEIVQEIQKRLLPQEFPSMGDLQVAGRCLLSMRGGGDYYDLLQIDQGLRGIIADVSGHDIGSAITMAGFRAIFRSLVGDPPSPGTLLQALRWAMHRDLLSLHQFISCWTFEYHSEGFLKISGAGHPPVLHFHHKQKKWSEYEAKHLPLGLADDTSPQNKKISIEPGDIVFFYTDGLFDPRMRATGFDKARFCDFVENNLEGDTKALVDKMIQEVLPHHRLLRGPDDIAILALQRRG